MTTCAVSTWDIHASGQQFRHTVHPCGLPTTSGRLCAHHEAERARLSERGRVMTEQTTDVVPVRVCCSERHHGARCPDGLVMCRHPKEVGRG